MSARLLALFFLSGLSALMYEVLWMRQCAILFGSAPQAAAMTLSVFFLGMSAGSWLCGTRAARSDRPLRLYARLEAGVAVSGLTCLFLIDAFDATHRYASSFLPEASELVLFVKMALAAALLLPTSILLGGTLPAMAQHLIRQHTAIGTGGSLLYGLNTAGGACGVLAAGFLLPPWIGVTPAFLVASACSAAIAWVASRLGDQGAADPTSTRPPRSDAPAPWAALLAIAVVSGFATVGMEVLWTRMFAQVLQSSVYSFSIILVTFLTAMALGGVLAGRLSRIRTSPILALVVLATAAGAAVGLSPFVFTALTGGLRSIAPHAGWVAYVGSVAANAAVVMLFPGVLMGAVFPYLFRLAQSTTLTPGELIGRLAAANTLGAAAGGLIAGFVMIPALGLWGSIRAMAIVYLVVALSIARRGPAATRWWTLSAPAVVLVLLITALDPARLPQVLIDHERGEMLVDLAESGQGIVAVVERDGNRFIKVDNYYSLGGTQARRYEQAQADIPIVIHPEPRSVFFLGVGTGITAGTALLHPVEGVTAVELMPDVIAASRKHFADYTNGLFSDPRARVVAADGRQYLAARNERYDVIVADLFIPWNAAEAGLYAREHFEVVRSRLKRGGLFAQWLPLYQLSKEDTFVIIRTMLSVFPQVTVWRGDFLPHRPIVAIIGQERGLLDVGALVTNSRKRQRDETAPRAFAIAMMGVRYGGNLTECAALFADSEIDRDDRPIIEYRAPIAHRQRRSGAASWFTTTELLRWYEEIFRCAPPESDPYLTMLGPADKESVRAGLALFAAATHGRAGERQAAAAAAAEFRALASYDVEIAFDRELARALR